MVFWWVLLKFEEVSPWWFCTISRWGRWGKKRKYNIDQNVIQSAHPATYFTNSQKILSFVAAFQIWTSLTILSRSLVGYVALSDLSMASGKSNDFDVRSLIILKMRKYMRDFSFCCVFFGTVSSSLQFFGIRRNILIFKIPNWTTVLYSTCKNLTCRTQANSRCSMRLEHYK